MDLPDRLPPIFHRSNPGCMTIPPQGDCFSCPPGYSFDQMDTTYRIPGVPPPCVKTPPPSDTPVNTIVADHMPAWQTAALIGGGIAAVAGAWWFLRRR